MEGAVYLQLSGFAFIADTATWCGPCREMKPVAERLARKYKVEMALVDFDQSLGVVREFSVESLPVMVLLDSEGLIPPPTPTETVA